MAARVSPAPLQVAMLNWTDGTGTARYWALKLIIDTLVPFEDSLYNTTFAPSSSSNPFCGSVINLTPMTLQVRCMPVS